MSHFWQGQVIFYYFRGGGSRISPQQPGRAITSALAFSLLDYAELPYWSMLLYYFKVEGTSFLLVYSTMSLDNKLFIKKHLNLRISPSKMNIYEIMYFF